MLGLLIVAFAAAFSDWHTRRIPNEFLLQAACYGFFYHGVMQNQWLDSIVGSIIGFCLLSIPYVVRAIGGGDLKLLMVVGLFAGVHMIILVFFCMSIAGGIIAAFVKWNWFGAGKISREWGSHGSRQAVPYAVAIFLGILMAKIVPIIRL